VVNVGTVAILDAQVINNKGETYVPAFMPEQPWSVGLLIIIYFIAEALF